MECNESEKIMSGVLGTLFYSIVLLTVGAVVVRPVWNWISAKFPWNNK